jgi:hypothetical protein
MPDKSIVSKMFFDTNIEWAPQFLRDYSRLLSNSHRKLRCMVLLWESCSPDFKDQEHDNLQAKSADSSSDM